MFRHLLSFVIGVAITALAFVLLVVPIVRESWRAQGFNEGSISARLEISEKLGREFPGKPIECGDERSLFDVKATSVYVLDCPQGRQIHVVK
jgi:hypothetical protein